LRRDAQERLQRTRLDADVNAQLQRSLVEINDRDSDATRLRLDEIESALEGEIDGFDRLLFGGSVAKHTWVDGLSDVDCLIVLDQDEVAGSPPAEMREQVANLLRRRLDLGAVTEIEVGRMAVTVRYDDGTVIQLLPAVQRGDALAISSATGGDWASIDPKRFAQRLSDLNSAQAGAVVPAIKLAKAILAARLSEEERPTGYHVEALAVAAFDGYDGPRTPKAMTQRFFERAATDILRPIPDVTGQSRHVDADLGAADSAERRRLARNLARIARAMETSNSVADWQALLD
jgi:hypothetical protein